MHVLQTAQLGAWHGCGYATLDEDGSRWAGIFVPQFQNCFENDLTLFQGVLYTANGPVHVVGMVEPRRETSDYLRFTGVGLPNRVG
jgi:hypothetical protein